MMRNGIVTLLSRLIALLPNDSVMPTTQAAEDDDEEEKEVEEEAQEDETKEEQGEDEEIVEEEGDSEEEKMEKKPKQAERKKKERERKQTKEELNRSAKEVMLEILDRRFLDVSSYTRSKVLQAWCYLMENRAVPIHMIPTLAERVTERLTDKAVQVRKNALQLFVLLLTFNPYGPSLRLSSFRQRLDRCLKGTEQEADQQKQEKKRTFLSSAQAFILHVHRAVELVSTHLLGSRTATDVIEAIHFLVCCAEFGVENAQAMGVRKMLMLIWSKDAQVRQALMDAYVRLYFSSSSAQEGDDSNKDEGQWLESLRKKAKLKNLNKTKANALCIAGRLIGLTIGANLAELTSLEEMIKELTAQKLISKDVIDMLCDIFSLEIDSVSAEESRNALLILSMTANANPDIIRSNLNLIVAVGLGPRSEEDELLGRFACLALQKLKHQQQQRLPNEHPLFAKLQRFVLSSLSRTNHQNWYSAAEQAINTIFVLAQRPDQVCVSILNGLYKPLHRVINDNADEDENDDEADKEEKEDGFSNGDLSKLLFVLGHVALKMLVYMEEVYAQLSRERHQAKEDLARQKEEEAKNKRHNKKTVKRKTQKRVRGKKHVEDDEDDEEMGEEQEVGKTEEQETAQAELEMAAGAVREEQESEWMHQLTEHHLVCDAESLFGAFAPLVVHVCLDPKQQFSANLLKSSAVLALCKFMCISSKFCEQNLQLLFTLHQKAEDASIRANISIALGDLALRFPNLLEPWTSHIYAALRDPSTKVRRNTLMVLTHLILNDMLKVKGNIAAMAQCLLDPDERTNQLAHLFFHELAQKGQSIYNILPDVLSHLSASEDVSSQDLRTIMNYLLSFIQKEKQTESLVMKLCHRFTTICCAGGTRQKQQCEDIAHCLEQLNYNGKSIRKLVELQKLWAPALRYPVVHQHFLGIVSKAKKFAKAEQKTAAEELESRMEEIRKKLKGDGELEVEEGEDDEADAEEDIGEQENMKKVEPTRRRNARKRGHRKEGQKTSRRGKKAPSYIDSDEEEGEEENYGDDSEDERKEQEAEELLQDLSENEEEEEEEEAKEEEEKVQESEDEPIRKRNVHTKLRKAAATIDPEEEEREEEKEEKEAIVLKQKKPVKRTAKRTAKRITTKKTATARVVSKTTKPPVRKARRAAKKQRAEELVVSSEEEEEEPKTKQPQHKTRQVKKKKVIYGEETDDDDDYED
ncbi:meiotic chromosome condensation, variant 2 [Balamuthia mandrillaris]